MDNIPKYKLIFLANDILSVSFAFMLYILLIEFDNLEISSLEETIILVGYFIIILFFFPYLFRSNNLYKINTILSTKQHTIALLKSANWALFLLVVLIYFFDVSQTVSLEHFLSTFLITAPFFYIIRVFLFTRLYKFYSNNYVSNKILIVGNGNAGKLIAAQMFIENSIPLKIVGFIKDDDVIGNELLPNVKVLGNLNQLEAVIKEQKVDEVILSIDNSKFNKIINIIDKCNKLHVRIRLASNLFKVINERFDAEKYYEVPVLNMSTEEVRKHYSSIKRASDIIFASFALSLFMPIIAITFLLIKVTSKGPAIFSQERVGFKGKRFTLYKFRSMYIDDDQDNDRKEKMISFMDNKIDQKDDLKIINETRLTPIGKFIRKTSIDEIPQLFNVIKGDMSLVGPRPCLPYEYEHYLDWQKRRTNVMPGCTGLWQIIGRNSVSFIDSIIMDVYYTFIQSPLTDLELILRTLPSMIFAKGK